MKICKGLIQRPPGIAGIGLEAKALRLRDYFKQKGLRMEIYRLK
ncbi:hypothetical protein [Paenibacillus sp. USDA918EY]|nr:hypothetical protein [Paenibacillus sp. USDA918EY]